MVLGAKIITTGGKLLSPSQKRRSTGARRATAGVAAAQYQKEALGGLVSSAERAKGRGVRSEAVRRGRPANQNRMRPPSAVSVYKKQMSGMRDLVRSPLRQEGSRSVAGKAPRHKLKATNWQNRPMPYVNRSGKKTVKV